MGIGIDGEAAADVHGLLQQIAGRVLAFRPRVDLDRDVVVPAGCEDGGVVELGLRTSPPDHNSTRAVSEDVQIRILDGGEHPLRHHVPRGPQFGMHARDDDVEGLEHVRGLIESSVLVDVDLDATQHPKGRRSGRCFSGQLSVDALDLVKLSHQTLSRQSVRDGQAGRVIGHHDVLVAQRTRSVRHLDDRAAAVGPQRVRVTVPAQRVPQRITGHRKGSRLGFQLREVAGNLTRQSFPNHRFGGFTDPLQGAKLAGWSPSVPPHRARAR